MIYHKGFQIPSCEHTVKYIGESQPCARWWPAGWTLVARWWTVGCPNPPSTSDLGLPHKILGYVVNKVVFEQLRASCVDWWNNKYIFFLLPTFFEMFKYIFWKQIWKNQKHTKNVPKMSCAEALSAARPLRGIYTGSGIRTRDLWLVSPTS